MSFDNQSSQSNGNAQTPADADKIRTKTRAAVKKVKALSRRHILACYSPRNTKVRSKKNASSRNT